MENQPKEMICVEKEKLSTILLRCIGDTRECPHCRKAFVPEDWAQKDAWKFYNDTFGMPAANKFERRAFEKIDEETLHEISRPPLNPGKVWTVKPPVYVGPHNCEVCKYSKEIEYQKSFLKCHRHAPIAHVMEHNRIGLVWPSVGKQDWCGDFEAKQPEVKP